MNPLNYISSVSEFFRIRPYPSELELKNTSVSYWGQVTSTIDWCEENYTMTSYIAEFSNTLSNLIYVVLSLIIVQKAIKYNLEKRFVFIGLGFCLVGVGSWFFHMSLQYEYQLLDELPMIYATCIPAWSIFSEPKLWTKLIPTENKKGHLIKDYIIGAIIVIFSLAVTWSYLIIKNPIFQEVAYGFLNLLIIGLTTYYTQKYVSNKKDLNNLKKCALIGCATFLLGFFFWNLDVHFCSCWRYVRRSYLLLPLGNLLEFHAWWHLLTGIGIYYIVQYLEFLRIIMHNKQDSYVFVWRLGFIPELCILQKFNDNGKRKRSYSLTFRGPLIENESKKNYWSIQYTKFLQKTFHSNLLKTNKYKMQNSNYKTQSIFIHFSYASSQRFSFFFFFDLVFFLLSLPLSFECLSIFM